MKHNPRINEEIARIPGFAHSHPMQAEHQVQGNLELIWTLEQTLAEIFGMPRVTLQPVAGAHGELTGILMVHKALAKSGNARKYILIPDSAHGTNPASAAFSGYEIKELKSNSRGTVDLGVLEQAVTEDVAALMITVPNTLGVFESEIRKMAEILHAKGAYLYCDGANLNSFVGIARPGDMGIDVIHSNLHKTFSTPHGGGGPGAGPVGVSERLVPFLPTPTIARREDGTFYLDEAHPDSIGRMRGVQRQLQRPGPGADVHTLHGSDGTAAHRTDRGSQCELHPRPGFAATITCPTTRRRCTKSSSMTSCRRRKTSIRSTSPSASWTMASIRRRSTSP